jgi:hypothetical protein
VPRIVSISSDRGRKAGQIVHNRRVMKAQVTSYFAWYGSRPDSLHTAEVVVRWIQAHPPGSASGNRIK